MLFSMPMCVLRLPSYLLYSIRTDSAALVCNDVVLLDKEANNSFQSMGWW